MIWCHHALGVVITHLQWLTGCTLSFLSSLRLPCALSSQNRTKIMMSNGLTNMKHKIPLMNHSISCKVQIWVYLIKNDCTNKAQCVFGSKNMRDSVTISQMYASTLDLNFFGQRQRRKLGNAFVEASVPVAPLYIKVDQQFLYYFCK